MNRTDACDAPRGTGTLLWVLWATYGSFYFCRTNLAVALPGIEREFGFDKSSMGTVLAGLKVAYAVGQLVNGQLAERFSPKRMLAIGLVLSAGLNIAFGFGASIWFFAFVWALNGYSQALGWTPTMRVVANWIPPLMRGRSIGVIGTGYMVSASLTYIVAGRAAESSLGWRGALWVPSAILLVSCIHMLVLLREAPESRTASGSADAGSDDPRTGTAPAPVPVPASHAPFLRTFAETLRNPDLWLVAFALGLVNACRYGYLDWGVSLIKDVRGATVDKAAIEFAILPAGGIIGSLATGWATDRFFGGRRAPLLCALLLALALMTIGFETAVQQGPAATVCALFVIGVLIYGPQVLLVGTAPADLARHGTVAAAVGFVNFMGYLGAAAGDKITGMVAHGDKTWSRVYLVWAAWAALAAGLVAILWIRTARAARVVT